MSGDPEPITGLRQVLVQQFLLHEVEHHDLQTDRAPDDPPLVPVAHGLIDIYKCLHQGEFGVGHTIDHPEGFRQRLHREVMHGTAAEPVREPVVEPVSADGQMLRVNLQALRSAVADDVDRAVDDLVQACVASARITRGDSTRFFQTLDGFMRLNRAGELVLAGHVFAFPGQWVETFLFEVRELMRQIRQVPVFSHSESYKRLNRPSYRVVVRSVLEASPLARILER
jgi:hypothetical protein